MGRTLYLGDLQAQYKVWKSDVASALVSADRVIQLGNLTSVSKHARDQADYGRNEAVLKIWDGLTIDRVRLMGRNEMAALNAPNIWTNSASNALLRDLWLVEDAPALTAWDRGGRLITHGGLTYGEWVAIGSPRTAREAAMRLNEKYAQTLVQGPCFALHRTPNGAANPIWADPIMELYPSWILAPEECPFDQLHGGETLNSYRGREAVVSTVSPLSSLETIRQKKYGASLVIQGATFTGITPDLPTETVTTLPQGKALYMEVE